jgi:beta-phosphoglucomutase
VFDLDGVLIDSTPCHQAAFEEVLEPLGISNFEYSRYAGWRTPEVIKDMLRRSGHPCSEETIASLAAEKSRLSRNKLRASNPVEPRTLFFVRALAAHYVLALASSGSRASVDLFLAANDCASLFRSVLSGDDVDNAKPDREIYRRSFENLCADPGECAVVEDAVSGIVAAQAAGAGMIIGIAWRSPGDRLVRAGATHTIDGLDQLAGVLNSTHARARSR